MEAQSGVDTGDQIGVHLIQNPNDWADAILALPTESACATRTILVPNQRVAHTLRRTLLERNQPHALAGTRFIQLLHLAQDILFGEACIPNDRTLGPLLVREAFHHVNLTRLKTHDLLTQRGWDEAFSSTLAELEAALLTPEQLLHHTDRQVADVGRIFADLRNRGAWVSAVHVLQAATERVAAYPFHGPVLSVVTGFESQAEANLLRALPNMHWAVWGVRPLHASHTTRLARLFGTDLTDALSAHKPHARTSTCLSHVQSHLFERADHSITHDASLRIAIYAGIHEEVEAAAGWIVEQIVEHGVPLDEIALLSPAAEPYGSLLRQRLAAIPWPSSAPPTFSQDGIPLTELSDGARLLNVVRAFREGLSREALASILPLLRRTDPEVWGGGPSDAWQLLNEVAALGGERSHLAAGCDWPDAWQRCLSRLQEPVPTNGLEERANARREWLRRELSALLEPISAMRAVLQRVVSDAPLPQLWQALERFSTLHVKLSPTGAVALGVLGAGCDVFAAQPSLAPRGTAALDSLEERLCSATLGGGRFGGPQIYLGTLAGVRGLQFRAVRILGLVEGALPSAVREDPVLSDAARSVLSDTLPTSRERAHRQIASFHDAVCCAREQLVLSAPRVSVEGSVRQPAAVLLDVSRLLPLREGSHALAAQLEAAAHHGRQVERTVRERLALCASARLERVAAGDRALLDGACNPALSIARMRSLRERTVAGVQDGLLFGVLSAEQLAGLSPERPISATRLANLLGCPHRFLYQNLLGFDERAGALPAHELESRTFGNWLHGIAEAFWRIHGARLGARDGTLEAHRAALREFARAHFEALRPAYPFANEEIAQATREELCDQLEKFLLLDWGRGAQREFVDVERAFGFDSPCVLDSASGPLHVRGKIDRMDRESSLLVLRDLKTGKGKPRRADDPPDVRTDLQLALYARVARVMAPLWQTPERVRVAYVYTRRGVPERGWAGADFAQLDAATDEWLATAVEVLQQGAFVRSAHDEDCRFCAYRAVCGPDLEGRAAVLQDARVPRRLRMLKAGEGA